MDKDYTAITARTSKHLRTVRGAIPETSKAFSTLAQSATQEGVLSTKTKELIAVALAVASRCDPCIGFHIQALIKHGGTKEELAETLGMCVYMGGGPSLMYAAEAMAAFEQFSGASAPQP